MILDRQKKQTWSIGRYATLLVVLVTILFLAISAMILVKLHGLMTESLEGQQRMARAEINRSLNDAIQSTQSTLASLAHWDETSQQLSNPAYYTYWHDYRVVDTGLVNPTLSDVAIYDAKGEILGTGRSSSTMPAQIKPDTPSLILDHQSGELVLFGFSPILRQGNAPIGYVAIRTRFEKILRMSGGLHHIRENSLSINKNPIAISGPSKASPEINFELLPDDSHAAVASLLTNSLTQLALLISTGLILVLWFLHYRLVRPLRQLSQLIDDYRNESATDAPLDSRTQLPVTELENVRKSLHEYRSQLLAMQSTLEQSNAQLWSQAHLDAMTSAYNRRSFDEDWAHLAARIDRRDVRICLVLFDCDHFKAINDTYGHQVGDDVIRHLASALISALRHGERLYRLGGDEFACLLADASNEDGLALAHRAEQAIGRHDFRELGILEPVRISVGIAHYHGQNREKLQELPRQADLAMYLAKRPGNQKIAVYDQSMAEMSDAVISNMETTAVYEALSNIDLLEMAYQPVVSLPALSLSYYEALVRIRYMGKLIIPGGIFPVIEARRLEAEFDLAVVSRIARDIELGLIPSGTGVAINISGPGILHSAVMEKLRTLSDWTRQYRIVIEITETALITQIGFASINLNELRKLGFFIALDDFGSGYSSMRYLSNMPVDIVKFDISLIRNLSGNSMQKMIVESLAKLICNAGYKAVAEGIETEEVLQIVTAVGFTHAQGYHLGRPQQLFTPVRP